MNTPNTETLIIVRLKINETPVRARLDADHGMGTIDVTVLEGPDGNPEHAMVGKSYRVTGLAMNWREVA